MSKIGIESTVMHSRRICLPSHARNLFVHGGNTRRGHGLHRARSTTGITSRYRHRAASTAEYPTVNWVQAWSHTMRPGYTVTDYARSRSNDGRLLDSRPTTQRKRL